MSLNPALHSLCVTMDMLMKQPPLASPVMAGLQQPSCDHENRRNLRPLILELLSQGPQMPTFPYNLLSEKIKQQPSRSGPLLLQSVE